MNAAFANVAVSGVRTVQIRKESGRWALADCNIIVLGRRFETIFIKDVVISWWLDALCTPSMFLQVQRRDKAASRNVVTSPPFCHSSLLLFLLQFFYEESACTKKPGLAISRLANDYALHVRTDKETPVRGVAHRTYMPDCTFYLCKRLGWYRRSMR